MPRRWSTEDFDALSWHDCHVHALRVVEGEHGAGDLELDLDYILEWRSAPDGFTFRLVPCHLRFHGVSGLRIALDWATPSAALGPFSLGAIERRIEVRDRYSATLWSLVVNWPAGAIDFEATGFTQQVWGREVVSPKQVLNAGERVAP